MKDPTFPSPIRIKDYKKKGLIIIDENEVIQFSYLILVFVVHRSSISHLINVHICAV